MASFQVRGISNSMFFLSFCGRCSLSVQFPRTHRVETSVTGGPDTTHLSLKKENLRKTQTWVQRTMCQTLGTIRRSNRNPRPGNSEAR